ncbi:DUF3806 domain-containing protein [Agarilytica rhodophyticola]|uniref:DUF3806 domain-containing protein n=1 Tax=Agarilytica rhodophyticola TaxID=1737490 RepID=UPI000B3430D6|nr:DUF3806 domain-containing protein [Agarilytica rhodophyticola]
MFYRLSFIILLITFSFQTTAQQNKATLFTPEGEAFPRVRPLNFLNEQFLEKQRQRVDSLTRKHFGKNLGEGKTNIPLLQRIIRENILEKTDVQELQALGVVLGDIYVESHQKLNWQVYQDDLGKSHAVCIDNTKHCIFPVTMLSRRMEVGSQPDVNRVYKKGIDAIKQYLPQLPFQRD